MPKQCFNRLSVVGDEDDLVRFQETAWEQESTAKFSELLQCSPTRYAVQFETEDESPLGWLREASRQWPRPVFLLDYEIEEDRCKGLAKAKEGKVKHYRIHY